MPAQPARTIRLHSSAAFAILDISLSTLGGPGDADPGIAQSSWRLRAGSRGGCIDCLFATAATPASASAASSSATSTSTASRPTGSAGTTGPAGPTGPTGPAGPAGPAGSPTRTTRLDNEPVNDDPTICVHAAGCAHELIDGQIARSLSIELQVSLPKVQGAAAHILDIAFQNDIPHRPELFASRVGNDALRDQLQAVPSADRQYLLSSHDSARLGTRIQLHPGAADLHGIGSHDIHPTRDLRLIP